MYAEAFSVIAALFAWRNMANADLKDLVLNLVLITCLDLGSVVMRRMVLMDGISNLYFAYVFMLPINTCITACVWTNFVKLAKY